MRGIGRTPKVDRTLASDKVAFSEAVGEHRKAVQKPSRHTSYFSALQLIADQSQRLIASLMPHHGERGRIAEEIIKGVLLRTLPKRFSVGTGVIVSAAGDVSAQTDIIIYDNFHNSPLLSEFGPGVYPVEIVYATVEVKSVLTKAEVAGRIAYKKPTELYGSEGHALLSLYVSILKGQQNFSVYGMDIDPYLPESFR